MRTLRAVTVGVLAIASAGCTMAALREQQSQAARVRYEVVLRDGSAYALKRNVEARGLRSCAIVQHESAFKTEAEEARLTGSSFESERRRSPPLAVSSRVRFSVDRSGAVRMQASSSTFPHSDMFFMIDGQRLRGRENVGVLIAGRALQALVDEKPFDYSYFTWPSGENAGRDVFRGFRAVMEECRAYVSARS
jgi:hypothetical protein